MKNYAGDQLGGCLHALLNEWAAEDALRGQSRNTASVATGDGQMVIVFATTEIGGDEVLEAASRFCSLASGGWANIVSFWDDNGTKSVAVVDADNAWGCHCHDAPPPPNAASLGILEADASPEELAAARSEHGI